MTAGVWVPTWVSLGSLRPLGPKCFTSPALQLTRLIPALLSSLWGSSGRDVQAEFLLNFISVG